MFESAHLSLTSQNKNKSKDATEGSSQQNKKNEDEEFTCYFCKKSGHMRKECPKYIAWRVKKGKYFALVCIHVGLPGEPNAK